jgi:hypothetical protein
VSVRTGRSGGGWGGLAWNPHRGSIGAVWTAGGFPGCPSRESSTGVGPGSPVRVGSVGHGPVGPLIAGRGFGDRRIFDRPVDVRGLSLAGVLDGTRPLSHWRRSGVRCCRIAEWPAVTKPVGYLLWDYPSLSRLAWSPRSPDFILLDYVDLNVELTWKPIFCWIL